MLLTTWFTVGAGSFSAFGDEKQRALEPLARATLDVDHNGKSDQARLIDAPGTVDLEIDLGARSWLTPSTSFFH